MNIPTDVTDVTTTSSNQMLFVHFQSNGHRAV